MSRTAPRYAPGNRAQLLERHERRSFRDIVARIVYHHADPETVTEPEPATRFVCQVCRHAKALCTCTEMRTK